MKERPSETLGFSDLPHEAQKNMAFLWLMACTFMHVPTTDEYLVCGGDDFDDGHYVVFCGSDGRWWIRIRRC